MKSTDATPFIAAILFLILMTAMQPVSGGDEPSSEASEMRPAAPFIREGTFNQDPANGKLKGKMLRIKRPLLIVKNLERSVEFYVDVIGLELYSIEDTYNRDPASLGYEMFNIPPGSRKRMALLNTSDEVRGMTLQEVLDMGFLYSGSSPEWRKSAYFQRDLSFK